MNTFEIIQLLRADNSRNYKIDTLRAHADNILLQRVCHLALNPLINFYQRKIPVYQSPSSSVMTLADALENLNSMINREVTGNAAIAYLTNILQSTSADDAEVIKLIIQKDLKCGVASGSINAVWPKLIPDYPVMLCAQFEQKLVDKITWPAAVQLKMDGMRVNAIVHKGKCEFRSRNGKELNLLGYLESEFIALANGKDVVFDGELLVRNADNNISDRQTGNGILNKASKGTISDSEAKLVIATIWDMIPYASFLLGYHNEAYSVRLKALSNLDFPNSIRVIEHQEVNSYEEALTIFESYLSQGQEGIILKDYKGPWENKRAKHQIKFKGELECDLKLVGFQEGTGKYEGMIGALMCESEDGVIKVNVGSGLKDEDRKETYSIGQIVAVKYNARIKNKQGEESLFLPIFIEARLDKTVADSSKNIK
jgi:hypothetical protein